MPDSDEDLKRRLAAVERALDGCETGERSVEPHDVDALETRLATLESRVDELDAAVQAVRGFLGGVSAVNEAVERRADAAVTAVERLEARLDGKSTVQNEPTRPDGEDSETSPTDGDSTERDDNPTVHDGDSTERDDNPTVHDGDSTAHDGGLTAQGLRERLRGLR